MRHYNEGPKVDRWYEETEEGSASWDLCRRCGAKVEGESAAEFGLPEGPNGDPLETVSEGESVIDYSEESGYECDICNRPLTLLDN